MTLPHEEHQEQQDDLIKRLCEACDRNAMPIGMMKDLIAEAIGEIEMLRQDAKYAREYMHDRDAARREVCELIAQEGDFKVRPQSIAWGRGWECFSEVKP